jgi:DNA-binding transcriptional LysR family regulator
MSALGLRVLTPALCDLLARHPNISMHITEGYSHHLVDMVRADRLDFAIVPEIGFRLGLRVRPFTGSPEVLISSASTGRFIDRVTVNLGEVGGIKLVLPSGAVPRRQNIEQYCSSHGVTIDRLLEVDGMVTTLNYVARTDWVTVLPAVVIGEDTFDKRLVANSVTPDLHMTMICVESSRRVLSHAAEALLLLLLEMTHREINGWLSSLKH